MKILPASEMDVPALPCALQQSPGYARALLEMGADVQCHVACVDQTPIGRFQVVSRKMDPRIPAVLSFGKIVANGATNVIPNEVLIDGTFRTFDESWREKAHGWIKDCVMQTVILIHFGK